MNYTFRNKATGEEFIKSMSMAEREPYLEANPDIEQIITGSVILDAVGLGITKPPSDFQKHVLGKIQAANPTAPAIASRRWGIPREI